MNGGIDPVFYGVVCGAVLWLALLWAGARCRIGSRSRAVKVAYGFVTVLLLFAPLSGMPLWNWAFSFCPNPSLPMLGIVCAVLWQHLCGVAVFKRGDWRGLWRFGALAGTVLYLHPIFLGGVDLYYWGWHHEIAVWSMAAMAVGALLAGNRTGVLFLGALIAYELQALESLNGWDYVIDPFYWLLSVGLLTADAARRGLAARARRRASRAPFPAVPSVG